MSERLTDQDLAVIEHMRSRTTPGEWFVSEEDGDICSKVTHTEGELSLCEDVGSLDSDADNCFTATAHEMVPAMLAELRERRAADLSAEDIGALRNARVCVDNVNPGVTREERQRALAALDKLIAAGGKL